METDRQKVGKRGESEACRYLMSEGHAILERNWRGGHLEIDIITLDRRGIHFVEVKSRTAPLMAEPQENVGPAKQRRLARAALAYLHSPGKAQLQDSEVFFDIITVVFHTGRTTIEYYPQAFIPEYV